MNRSQAREQATRFMERYLGEPRELWGGAVSTREELTRLYMNQVNLLDRFVSRFLLVLLVALLGVCGLCIALGGAQPPPVRCVEVVDGE